MFVYKFSWRHVWSSLVHIWEWSTVRLLQTAVSVCFALTIYSDSNSLYHFESYCPFGRRHPCKSEWYCIESPSIFYYSSSFLFFLVVPIEEKKNFFLEILLTCFSFCHLYLRRLGLAKTHEDLPLYFLVGGTKFSSCVYMYNQFGIKFVNDVREQSSLVIFVLRYPNTIALVL